MKLEDFQVYNLAMDLGEMVYSEANNRKLISNELYVKLINDIETIGVKLNNYINTIGPKPSITINHNQLP